MTAKNYTDRRTFVKCTLSGLGGLPLLRVIGFDQERKAPITKGSKRNVVHRTLGKTGLKVPVIGMGMIHPGDPTLIRGALDAGITHFDTTASPLYHGRNEEVIGQAIKGWPRQSFVIGSKITSPKHQVTGHYTDAATEAAFIKQLDAHLQRLQMDYVDILYQHDVRQAGSCAGSWESALGNRGQAHDCPRSRGYGQVGKDRRADQCNKVRPRLPDPTANGR